MVIELQKTSSILLAILIPIIILVLTVIISYLAKKESNSKINRVAKFLTEPFQFKPLLKDSDLSELPEIKTRKIIGKEILFRLNLVYYIIVIFLLCSFLGELYQVLADRTLLIIFTNIVSDSAPSSSIWSTIVIESPFSSGFRGFQPWYGMYPNPILESQYYHQTWEWIFYTSGVYNNFFPNMQYHFFGESVNTLVFSFSGLLMVFMLIIGTIFLLPLLWKEIRKSFLASLFFLEAGMIIGTKGVFSSFAQAWKIEVNDQLLQYGAIAISRASIAAEWVILGLIPVIIGFFFFFLWIGKRIWKVHYSQTESISKKTFLIAVSINYFVALIVLLF
ncbi:MAG: hypothetical protein HGN29_03445 [Asgard group archaeon]|nr:hypothetical protein [Asgard group archaeon]